MSQQERELDEELSCTRETTISEKPVFVDTTKQSPVFQGAKAMARDIWCMTCRT